VSVLAHVFENAGLATVGISLVRGQAETVKPPRILNVNFPLGRPLGKPGDAAFQTSVLMAMFELLPRTDVPVLVDFPDTIEEQGSEPSSCPMPPRHNPDLNAAVDEAAGLRNAYDRNLEATGGRTLIGRIADVDGVVGLIEKMIEIESGTLIADVGWDPTTAIAASQDIRAYYEEAGLQLADNTGARQIETWFFHQTETGQLIRRARDGMREREEDTLAVTYLAPMTQG
jgi:hypothetical protein